MHISLPNKDSCPTFDIELIEARGYFYHPGRGPRGVPSLKPKLPLYTLILQGSNEIRLDRSSLLLQAGDALLLKPGDSGSAHFGPSLLLEVINVYFNTALSERKPLLQLLPRQIPATEASERFRLAIQACRRAHLEGNSRLATSELASLLLEAAKLNLIQASRAYSRTTRLALRYIQDNHRHACSRDQIAAACRVTPNYLSNLIRRETGRTLSDQINHHTVERAKSLMQSTSLNCSQIADRLGLDPYHFSKLFKKHVGLSPRAYAKTLLLNTVACDK